MLSWLLQAERSEILRSDILLRFDSTPASHPTISRFFDRVTGRTNRQFKSIMQKQACRFISKHIDDIILDADSTLVVTNGRQEAFAYITHYNEKGYHTIIINEFNTKLLLSAQLRAGNIYSSNGKLKSCKKSSLISLLRIIVPSDSVETAHFTMIN